MKLCECGCGQATKPTQQARDGLRAGESQRFLHGHHPRRHGAASNGTRTKTYCIWNAMRQRCMNPRHPKFKRYGGRGITICARWNAYANFLEDMGEQPPGKTLDRKDNNGNYEPSNCRWATRSQQQRNTSSTKLSDEDVSEIRRRASEGKVSQKQLAVEFGIGYCYLNSIVKNRHRRTEVEVIAL